MIIAVVIFGGGVGLQLILQIFENVEKAHRQLIEERRRVQIRFDSALGEAVPLDYGLTRGDGRQRSDGDAGNRFGDDEIVEEPSACGQRGHLQPNGA